MSYRTLLATASVSAALAITAAPAPAHFIGVVGNNSIDGSLCVGFDCVAEEAFGFDTIRLKENNLRLDFQDTSAAAAFPPNDWRIIINDSANGGANHFSVEDRSAGNQAFRVFAGARNNALVVDSQGDVGIGTSTPATDIDIKIGDTPTVRLQQDGTSGFTPQTWDMAGNETNWFVRDATNGSTLPLRIRPGAPTSTIDIAGTGDVGINTASPTGKLHIRETGSGGGNADITLKLENTTASAQIALIDDSSGVASDWRFQNFDDTFRATKAGTGNVELELDASGNLTVFGNIVSGGGGTCDPGPCDAVFDPAVYTVPSIEEHAALMWENQHLPAVGPTRPGEPVNVTIKLTRMLNELEHAHIYIEQLNQRIDELEALIGVTDG